MVDRQFTEVDLRRMLEYATGLREDVVEGRWLIETWHLGHPWVVIVEPDLEPIEAALSGERVGTIVHRG